MEKNYPLILVFYLDAELMKVKEIIQPFAESVNTMLAQKNANAMAFFMPTKDKERVECINPMVVSEPDMEKINEMVEEIRKSFSIDEKVNLDDVNDMTDEEVIEELSNISKQLKGKPCDCGNNPNGECKCD